MRRTSSFAATEFIRNTDVGAMSNSQNIHCGFLDSRDLNASQMSPTGWIRKCHVNLRPQLVLSMCVEFQFGTNSSFNSPKFEKALKKNANQFNFEWGKKTAHFTLRIKKLLQWHHE